MKFLLLTKFDIVVNWQKWRPVLHRAAKPEEGKNGAQLEMFSQRTIIPLRRVINREESERGDDFLVSATVRPQHSQPIPDRP